LRVNKGGIAGKGGKIRGTTSVLKKRVKTCWMVSNAVEDGGGRNTLSTNETTGLLIGKRKVMGKIPTRRKQKEGGGAQQDGWGEDQCVRPCAGGMEEGCEAANLERKAPGGRKGQRKWVINPYQPE